MAVNVAEMKKKHELLDLDAVRKRLAQTEPLSQVTFPLSGKPSEVAKFKVADNWAVGLEGKEGIDKVDVFLTVNGKEYQLTKDSFLEATSLIGITKKYAERCPAKLLTPHLDYWFSHGPEAGVIAPYGEMKALAAKDIIHAFTKPTLEPFSNLEILDQALVAVEAKYGPGEVLVDFKFHHDLRRTAVRLIIPGDVRTPRKNDPWSIGVQFRNSLAAEKPFSVEGYMFRWEEANGAISTLAQSGKYNRRRQGQEADDVYEWARHSVETILSEMEHEFDAIEELVETEIEKDKDGKPNVNIVLKDIFESYAVPVKARDAIIDNMVNSTDLTMYGVMQAVTLAANDKDIPETQRNTLMEIGGDIPRANHERCQECRRIKASLN